MSDGYTEEDVAMIARILYDHVPEEPVVVPARAVVAALAAAGRLLPEGAEKRMEFGVRWHFADGEPVIDWGCADIEYARRIALNWPRDALRGDVERREHWDGPWSVVEPVAVKEASDG